MISVLCDTYLTGNYVVRYFQATNTSAVVTVEEGIHSSSSSTNFVYQTALTAGITAISRNTSFVQGNILSHNIIPLTDNLIF